MSGASARRRSAVAVEKGLSGPRLRQVYQLLLGVYGRQGWWPAKSRFEIMVGAVLTQNTAWSNVERAIANLKAADWLRPEAIAAAAPEALAELIREAMEEYRQKHIARRTSLRDRRPVSVGGPIQPITAEDDLLGEMLDEARD